MERQYLIRGESDKAKKENVPKMNIFHRKNIFNLLGIPMLKCIKHTSVPCQAFMIVTFPTCYFL